MNLSLLSSIIEQNPKGWNAILRIKHPSLYLSIKETFPDKKIGQAVYDLLNPDANKSCLSCGCLVKFDQFSVGYQKFCSCSCRAKHHECFKNAHDEDGKLLESAKIKIHDLKDEIVEKIKTTCLNRYGKTPAELMNDKNKDMWLQSKPKQLDDIEFQTWCKTKSLAQIAKSINESDINLSKLKKHLEQSNIEYRKKFSYSKPELELLDWLKTLGIDDAILSYRPKFLNKREIDIFIPSLNLGIEYCGLFWHSDRNNYGKNRHQDKFLLCKENDIKLITIFEDEFLFKKDIVLSRLKHLIKKDTVKIFARKTEIHHNVPSKIITEKLNSWHTSGSLGSSKNKCLIHNNEIIAIITYGKARFKNAGVEILRYATKPGITVVGGFSKLVVNLQKETEQDIISFSDNRWGDGKMYSNAGFSFEGITPPSYFYFEVKDKIRYHRSKFMKHHIVENMNGNIALTEYENMKRFGYNRIFDCGTSKWSLKYQ
jgi:hypothetical protein